MNRRAVKRVIKNERPMLRIREVFEESEAREIVKRKA
jgi:hypothetical protein